MGLLTIRTSMKHWEDLSAIVHAVERCMESCARLDAHRLHPFESARDAYATGQDLRVTVEHRVNSLHRRVEHELDKVTAERLTVELSRRIVERNSYEEKRRAV